MNNIRFCTRISIILSFAFLFNISSVITQASAAPMPVPAGQQIYSYIPASEPRKSSDPAFAIPVGLGKMAMGQDSIDVKVGFAEFSEPVDIYMGISAPKLNPEILLISKEAALQPVSQGLVKWRDNVKESIDETIFAGIPVSSLPEDFYTFYIIVTPAGNLGSSFTGLGDAFYLWSMSTTLPPTNSPGLGSIGQLPDQLIVSDGSIDETAAILAWEVLSGSSRTLPALMTAVQMAGIGVKNGDAAGISPGQASQGITVDAFELQFMAVLLSFGFSMPLGDVTSDLVGAAPEIFSGGELKNIVLDGIRDHAQNSTGQHRFWARFIVELGKQSSPSYDILNSSSGDISMNVVQINLILWRLAADLTVMPGLASASEGAFAVSGNYRAAQSSGGSSCEFTNPVSDYQAAAATFVFGKLYGMMDKLNHRIKGLSFGQNILNTALTYIKFAAEMALYEGKIQLEGEPPLHRTKYTGNNGERKNLKFKAKYNGENLQWINCFRTAFNSIGLDFSVPNGPIKGAGVQWKIYKGGKILVFAGGDTVHDNITDENGETSMQIEGRAQKKNLSNQARIIMKSGLVVTEVAAKLTKPQDIPDMVSTALGGGGFTLPVKLFERTHWLTSSYNLQVEDWTDDVLYTGTAKASFMFPGSNIKIWEITANVSFVKDDDLSSEGQDIYTTSDGTVTQTIYTGDPTGVCYYTSPYSFTDSYPVFVGDGDISITTNVEPVQYRGSASISDKTPLKVYSYNECCKYQTPECGQKTIEIYEQEHMWFWTGGSYMSAMPDGSLKGTYKEPMGASYEWEFKAEDNNL